MDGRGGVRIELECFKDAVDFGILCRGLGWVRMNRRGKAYFVEF